MANISGIALAEIAAGILLAWSGIENQPVGSSLRSLISGKKLAPTADAQTLSLPSSGGSNPLGSAPPGNATSGSNTHNLIEIGKYLMANGYTRAAAAGICGCIAGESGGDPESVGSGGNGLIGWTPPKPGIVTGNPTRDLNTQMPMIIQYNEAQGQHLIDQLNAIISPTGAADFYSKYFERPKITYSDVRPAVALMVYGAI